MKNWDYLWSHSDSLWESSTNKFWRTWLSNPSTNFLTSWRRSLKFCHTSILSCQIRQMQHTILVCMRTFCLRNGLKINITTILPLFTTDSSLKPLKNQCGSKDTNIPFTTWSLFRKRKSKISSSTTPPAIYFTFSLKRCLRFFVF